jgi:hypothetical protein
VRIQKARYRRTHFLVITGRKENLVHQKEVKGTHELESIKGATNQDRERKRKREGHSLPGEYKGRDMS